MFFEIPDRLLPGRPSPLGATYDGQGVNFAVFSANAEKIELCIFDAAGRKEVARLPLAEWDVPLDYVATEAEVIRCASGGP